MSSIIKKCHKIIKNYIFIWVSLQSFSNFTNRHILVHKEYIKVLKHNFHSVVVKC